MKRNYAHPAVSVNVDATPNEPVAMFRGPHEDGLQLLGDTPGYNQPLQARPRGKRSSGGAPAAVPALPSLSVRDCLHFTLTHDPDVALLGLSYPNEQDAAFAAALDFAPLSRPEMERIRKEAALARKDKGPCWWNPDPEM